MSPSPDALLRFAEALCDLARPIALRHFRTALDIVTKADESPVTVADRAIEAALRAEIEARFPEHGVFGEEMGMKPGSGTTWVIDPIDGTKSFVTGLPLFGTLIALCEDDRPVLGAIDMPALGERWTGGPSGATFNGAPARASRCERLGEAGFFTTSPEAFRGADEAILRRFTERTAIRRYGGDCYIYGLLASGHCDLVVECGLQPYDFAALVPVIEAAGGIVTDWAGEALTLRSEGRVLAAATRALHAEALALIAG